MAIWLSKSAKKQNPTTLVVALPDRGAGNDPEALGLAFHHQGPTFINAYCQAATNLVSQIHAQ